MTIAHSNATSTTRAIKPGWVEWGTLAGPLVGSGPTLLMAGTRAAGVGSGAGGGVGGGDELRVVRRVEGSECGSGAQHAVSICRSKSWSWGPTSTLPRRITSNSFTTQSEWPGVLTDHQMDDARKGSVESRRGVAVSVQFSGATDRQLRIVLARLFSNFPMKSLAFFVPSTKFRGCVDGSVPRPSALMIGPKKAALQCSQLYSTSVGHFNSRATAFPLAQAAEVARRLSRSSFL